MSAPATVTQPTDDLNDPARWIYVQVQGPPVSTKWFQEELDKICGRNSAGLSILRIVWGCDHERTSQFVFGEYRLRYRFFSKRFVNGDILDLGVPRYFLEELNEPGQARESWERQRYHTTEDHEILDCLGPYPEKGYYTHCWTIAQHEGGDLEKGPCCDRIWTAARRPCWGHYREPAEIDLTRVRRGWRRQLEHRRERPDEVLPVNVLQEAHAASFQSYKKWMDGVKDKTGAMIDDFMKTHAFSFTTDNPKVHKWGRYHFLGPKHSKSGSK